MVINLFGTGLIFHVSAENVYSRGPLNFLLYATLFLYFAESIYRVTRSKQTGITIEFSRCSICHPLHPGHRRPRHILRSVHSWLAAAVAMVFIHIQLQNINTFVDETSGLFNRKYMNFYLEKAHKTNPRQLYGIMMDVNDFKKINDRYGHSMGDRAIREIGKILSASLPEDAVAIRMAGDEFVILLSRGNDKMLEDTRAAIEDGLRHFNQTTTAPFKLSFSMGLVRYNGRSTESFLNELDQKMYAEKKAYHQEHPR